MPNFSFLDCLVDLCKYKKVIESIYDNLCYYHDNYFKVHNNDNDEFSDSLDDICTYLFMALEDIEDFIPILKYIAYSPEDIYG